MIKSGQESINLHIFTSSPDIATCNALGTNSFPFIDAPFSFKNCTVSIFLLLIATKSGLHVGGSIKLPDSSKIFCDSILLLLSERTYKGVCPRKLVQFGLALYFNNNLTNSTLFTAKNNGVGYIGIKVFISGFAENSNNDLAHS